MALVLNAAEVETIADAVRHSRTGSVQLVCLIDSHEELRRRSISALQHLVHENSKAKGFWEQSANIPEKLALIHSEVSEALEAYRETPDTRLAETYFESATKPKPMGFPSELADVAIRLMDLAECLGIDLEAAILQKHAYNVTRERLHGGKRA